MGAGGCFGSIEESGEARLFFRAVDAHRVMFTYGRDIRLSAEQKGDRLNYFIYPYAEADGKAVKDLKTHFAFQDLPPPGAASSGN